MRRAYGVRRAARDLAPIYAWVVLAVLMMVAMILLANHANRTHVRTNTGKAEPTGVVCTPSTATTGCIPTY